ncbi:MAG: PorT family protein [Cyclobacteriaceae bacterium]|nr:PorT family protein [Cyclobacteriaceae bacterium]
MRKILTYLIILFLIPGVVYAQNYKQADSKVASYGFDFSVDYYPLNPGSGFGSHGLAYSSTARSINFSAGIRSDIRLFTRFSLGSGLYLSVKDSEMKYYILYSSSLPEWEAEGLKMRYLFIPVTAKYYVTNNKHKIFSQAGVGLNLLVNEVHTNHDVDLLNQRLLTYHIGTGLTFNPVSRIEMDVGIAFERLLTDFEKSTFSEMNTFKLNFYIKPLR